MEHLRLRFFRAMGLGAVSVLGVGACTSDRPVRYPSPGPPGPRFAAPPPDASATSSSPPRGFVCEPEPSAVELASSEFPRCNAFRRDFACGAVISADLDAGATAATRRNDPRACCYRVVDTTAICANVPPNAGRPLRTTVTGPALFADVVSSAAFVDAGAALPRNDPELAAALAVAWLADARAEHAASVAFELLARQLLALDAPRSLVADCRAARDDEVRHARACFTLATFYAGRPLGPAALAVPDVPTPSLLDLAEQTLRDGCFLETVSALEAREGSGLAEDPVIARVLAEIARDEERHAELAWRMLAFCVHAGGASVQARVVEVATELGAATPGGDPADDPLWERQGRLGPRRRGELRAACAREIVLPCALELARVAATDFRPAPSPGR